ncbi:MAG: fasciclin domain-containing protein [Acidimicrobiia bacterium]|nr:fasciclin domain-containing protein [Acidimicrobiia bacterium]
MKKRFSILALLLAFAMVVAACSSESDDTTTTEPVMEEQSVLDLAIEAGQFSTLIAAIDAAGLAETLEGEGPFTVLAPTDAAFEAAFEALGITAADLLADTETLTAILTYHVLPQAADSQLVATLDGSSVPTVNGQSVDISVVDGQIMINEATVVSADLIADNGIVHVLDAVLLPPDIAEALGVAMAEDMEEETTTTTEATTTTTEAMQPTIAEIVVELAAGDPAEFTVLLAALETAGLVDALNGEGPFTVFAPTDAAFGALLEELGVTAEELLANPDLANILLYHVVSGGFLAADVIELAPIDVPTLYEENAISIAIVDGSVVINGVATVVTPDVMASNGVVHVIDAVLVPTS